jgi:hypothetical protein
VPKPIEHLAWHEYIENREVIPEPRSLFSRRGKPNARAMVAVMAMVGLLGGEALIDRMSGVLTRISARMKLILRPRAKTQELAGDLWEPRPRNRRAAEGAYETAAENFDAQAIIGACGASGASSESYAANGSTMMGCLRAGSTDCPVYCSKQLSDCASEPKREKTEDCIVCEAQEQNNSKRATASGVGVSPGELHLFGALTAT